MHDINTETTICCETYKNYVTITCPILQQQNENNKTN